MAIFHYTSSDSVTTCILYEEYLSLMILCQKVLSFLCRSQSCIKSFDISYKINGLYFLDLLKSSTQQLDKKRGRAETIILDRCRILKCYFDQKLTPIFFSINQKYSCLIYWAITKFKYGREQLRKLGREGSDVIQSRQQKQFGYFRMGQVSSWKVFAVVFYKYDRNSNWTRPCMTTVCQLVVVLCRIATMVQTREKEFLSIILLPAALFYHVERDSCPHITRTSTQPAVLLFALSISLTVLPGFIISEDPWNAFYRAQFPQHGRKKWKRYTFLSLLRFNISLLH